MERRLKVVLAFAASTTLASACLAIAAIEGGIFATASPPSAGGVHEIELVDDYIVVHSSTSAADTTLVTATIAVALPAPPTTIAAATTPARPTTASTVAVTTPPPITAAPRAAPRSPTPPPATVAAVAAVPAGAQIPADWPKGKAIPPLPAGCQQPQLEDNGVWNCQ